METVPSGGGGTMFQSLSGFLMRCDTAGFTVDATLGLFQSLSGFLMRCDLPSTLV